MNHPIESKKIVAFFFLLASFLMFALSVHCPLLSYHLQIFSLEIGKEKLYWLSSLKESYEAKNYFLVAFFAFSRIGVPLINYGFVLHNMIGGRDQKGSHLKYLLELSAVMIASLVLSWYMINKQEGFMVAKFQLGSLYLLFWILFLLGAYFFSSSSKSTSPAKSS